MHALHRPRLLELVPAWPEGILMKGSNFSRAPECLDLFAVQDDIAMVTAGRRVTAQASSEVQMMIREVSGTACCIALQLAVLYRTADYPDLTAMIAVLYRRRNVVEI